MARRIATIICLAACLAQAQYASLPLDGYYHPGRYMPVSISAVLPATIGGPDVIPTEMPEARGSVIVSATVPVLVLRPTTSPLTLTSSGVTESYTLRPLTDDQLLVGYTGSAPSELAALYPAASIIPIKISLDVAPVIAWSTLDLLVLDPATFWRLHPTVLAELLAGGIAVAVEQPGRPGSDWPWQQHGRYWLCRPIVAGPSGALLDHGYEPTLSWKPSWPARMRFGIVAAAVAMAAVVLILLLMRGRWTTPAAIAVLAVATPLAVIWHKRTPPVFQAAGTVVVRSSVAGVGDAGRPGSTTPSTEAIHQLDLWLYQTAGREIDSALPFADFTVPMLYSTDQPAELNLRLICRRDGSPAAFAFRLPANQRIGFLKRSISPPPIRNPQSAIRNPIIRQLAPLYQRPGDQIEPITPPVPIPGADDFGAILISRPVGGVASPPPATSPAPHTTAPSPAERSAPLPPPT